MPYQDEHSCRLHDPGLYEDDSFKRQGRKHEGKDYDALVATRWWI